MTTTDCGPRNSDSSTPAATGLASTTTSIAASIARTYAAHAVCGAGVHAARGVPLALPVLPRDVARWRTHHVGPEALAKPVAHVFPGPWPLAPGPFLLSAHTRHRHAHPSDKAHWKPVDFFPACFSRLASLLGPLSERDGPPLEGRKMKSQQSLRKVPGIERGDYNGEPAADQGGFQPAAEVVTICRKRTCGVRRHALQIWPPAATIAAAAPPLQFRLPRTLHV